MFYLFISDPEWGGNVCLVDSFASCGWFWCNAQVQSWCTGPTGQLHCPHYSLIVHYNVVRLEIIFNFMERFYLKKKKV